MLLHERTRPNKPPKIRPRRRKSHLRKLGPKRAPVRRPPPKKPPSSCRRHRQRRRQIQSRQHPDRQLHHRERPRRRQFPLLRARCQRSRPSHPLRQRQQRFRRNRPRHRRSPKPRRRNRQRRQRMRSKPPRVLIMSLVQVRRTFRQHPGKCRLRRSLEPPRRLRLRLPEAKPRHRLPEPVCRHRLRKHKWEACRTRRQKSPVRGRRRFQDPAVPGPKPPEHPPLTPTPMKPRLTPWSVRALPA